MRFNQIYALSLRHIYLISSSFPRIIDLIYWPTVQIFLWGFISKFFTLNSEYYSDTIGVILTAAILYDFLFRASISYNIMFLEEIWSRNFTNLFIAPIKISEIIASLTLTAIFRTLIGLVPAAIWLFTFGVSIFKLASFIFFISKFIHFWNNIGLTCNFSLLRFGLLLKILPGQVCSRPLGCIYYPIEILPSTLQIIAKALPLVHILRK